MVEFRFPINHENPSPITFIICIVLIYSRHHYHQTRSYNGPLQLWGFWQIKLCSTWDHEINITGFFFFTSKFINFTINLELDWHFFLTKLIWVTTYISIGGNGSCEDHKVVWSKALRLPITKGYKDCCSKCLIMMLHHGKEISEHINPCSSCGFCLK